MQFLLCFSTQTISNSADRTMIEPSPFAVYWTAVIKCVHHRVLLHTPQCTPAYTCVYTTVYACVHKCVHHSVHSGTPRRISLIHEGLVHLYHKTLDRKLIGYCPVTTLWCSRRRPVYLNVLNCCSRIVQYTVLYDFVPKAYSLWWLCTRSPWISLLVNFHGTSYIYLSEGSESNRFSSKMSLQ